LIHHQGAVTSIPAFHVLDPCHRNSICPVPTSDLSSVQTTQQGSDIPPRPTTFLPGTVRHAMISSPTASHDRSSVRSILPISFQKPSTGPDAGQRTRQNQLSSDDHCTLIRSTTRAIASHHGTIIPLPCFVAISQTDESSSALASYVPNQIGIELEHCLPLYHGNWTFYARLGLITESDRRGTR